MIQRYSRPEMSRIWSEENRYKAWLEVEILTSEAYGELGLIPEGEARAIRQNAGFSLERIAALEEITRHDVVAFTRAVSETLGPERKWIHYGLTSTDVVDTANGYLFRQVDEILEKDLLRLQEALKEKALAYRHTPVIGRTHGIHGEPTSFGLKFALWYEELNRYLHRFREARKDVECGKISGAVGNFAHGPLEVEEFVCRKLGIDFAKVSTQVLQRDRHAHYLSVLALIASGVEKMAVEIRHLQRTEVGEASEFFREGQKGSSAMPHKRNPIGSENISGCARVIRGYMLSAYENIPLWHERDISHSAPERIIFPDATTLLDYVLNRFAGIIEKLMVFPERMLENMALTQGLIYSQHVLLALISSGLSREDAYDLIQPLAMKAYQERRSYRELLEGNAEVCRRISKEEMDALFDPMSYLKNVDSIYTRLGL